MSIELLNENKDKHAISVILDMDKKISARANDGGKLKKITFCCADLTKNNEAKTLKC